MTRRIGWAIDRRTPPSPVFSDLRAFAHPQDRPGAWYTGRQMMVSSPFPGMDPWLERRWGDVHQRLVTYSCDQLQSRLPPNLRALMQERIVVEALPPAPRSFYPDVRVVEERTRRESGGGVAVIEAPAEAPPAAAATAAEPILVRYLYQPPVEGFIEIVDATTGDRVVTVIEFLSPWNKRPGTGQDEYLRKQRQLLEARTNLVEIDLVRSGRRVLVVPEDQLPASHRTTYRVSVTRGHRPGEAEAYRVSLREPLPSIRVPLRPTDADVRLELQPLLEQAYRNGRYDVTDYRQDPDPPLDAADAAWADEILRSKKLR